MFWLHLCLCTTYSSGICGGQKKMLNLLDLEFQIAVSHSGWWELNLILCRSRKCCLLLNEHSSPKTFSFMNTKLSIIYFVSLEFVFLLGT